MIPQVAPVGVSDIVNVEEVTGADIVIATAILLISILVAILANRYTKRRMASIHGLPASAASIIARLVMYAILVTGIMFALPLLGFDIQPLLLLLLFIAVLIFFGGQPLMENFTAGIILQARSPFAVGDLIQHKEFIGVVDEINGRVTVITTATGEQVSIPSVSILRNPITNLTACGVRRTTVEVGVAYGTDLDLAIEVIASAVNDLNLVLEDPRPTIGVASFDDSAVLINVRCWHLPSLDDEFFARDQIIRSIDRHLADAGIVIAFPQRDVWLRNDPTDGQGET